MGIGVATQQAVRYGYHHALLATSKGRADRGIDEESLDKAGGYGYDDLKLTKEGDQYAQY